MIRVTNLSFQYPNGQGIFNINIEVPERSVYLLTGTNGSGKSTLLKILAGGLREKEGEISFGKQDNLLTDNKLGVTFNVALSPQQAETQFSLKSVRSELRFTSAMTGISVDEKLEMEVVDALGLSDFLDVSPFDLLPADRKLLSLAIAALIPAPTIALDEPTAGLDPVRKRRIPVYIELLRDYGKNFLIVSHDIVYFLPLSTHIGILDRGNTVESASIGEFIENLKIHRYPHRIYRDFLLPRLGLLLASHPVVSTEELAGLLNTKFTDSRKN
jgi:energy-coupling factor transport system ATP-binding protein